MVSWATLVEIWSHYVSAVCSLSQLTSNKAHIVKSSHKMASLTSFLLIGGKCRSPALLGLVRARRAKGELELHMYLILTKCSNAQRAFHRPTDHKIFNRRIAAISSILAWLTAIKLSLCSIDKTYVFTSKNIVLSDNHENKGVKLWYFMNKSSLDTDRIPVFQSL